MSSESREPAHNPPPERDKLSEEDVGPELDVHTFFDELDKNNNGKLETNELQVESIVLAPNATALLIRNWLNKQASLATGFRQRRPGCNCCRML